MRMHRCNYLGCRVLVSMNDKFCDQHAEENKRDRDMALSKYKEGIKGSLKEQHDNRQAQKKYNEETRDSTATEFYHSVRWTKIANHVRVRDSYMSGVSGKILNNGDIQVDHVIKRELLDKERWYDTENLWLLSRREHQLKTSIELKLLRENRQNVLRNLDKDWWIKVLKERLYER